MEYFTLINFYPKFNQCSTPMPQIQLLFSKMRKESISVTSKNEKAEYKYEVILFDILPFLLEVRSLSEKSTFRLSRFDPLNLK